MTDTEPQWEINKKLNLSPLRATWLASTAIIIIFATSMKSSEVNNNYISWISTIFLYVIANSFITIKYFANQRRRQFIFIKNGVLYIPRFILRGNEIEISEIRSLEKYSSRKRDIGILVGRASRSPIFVGVSFFKSKFDFDDFFQTLDNLASINHKRGSRENIDALIKRQRTTSHQPIAIISLMLLAIYLLSSAQGFEKISDSFLLSGCLNQETIRSYQFYRIASSVFLHLSLWHLGINIFCFAIIGRHILVILGIFRFFNTFFLSAVGGSLASLIFSRFDAVVGASGGVLGLLGAYTYIWIKHHKELPGSVTISLRNLILVLAMQFSFDAIEPGVATSSHVGGFVFGFFYASRILHHTNLNKAAEASRFEQAVAIIAILMFIYGIQHFINIEL